MTGLPGEGSDGVVIGDHLREEDLDLGRRTAQQDGVNALLLAPASGVRDPGLQTGGDLLAEGVGERGGHHDRGLQYELGQARAERDQGEGDHAGSLRDRAAGMRGAGCSVVGDIRTAVSTAVSLVGPIRICGLNQIGRASCRERV